MFFKKSTFFIIIFVFLILLLFTNNKPAITGVEKDNVQINIGSDAGVTVGITGKVFYYYMNINSGKKEQINIASFRVESVEKNRCRARILEKKQNVEIGFWVSFDKELIVKKVKSPQAVSKPSRLEPAVKPPVQKADKTTNKKMELAFWDSIKDSKNSDDFQAYLNKFPNGTFAELAQNKIKYNEKREKRAEELKHRTSNYYSIQVGTYFDFLNAKKRSNNFSRQGYQTEILSVKYKDKGIYRVRMGRFSTLEEAKKVKEILEKKDGMKYRIVQTPFVEGSLFSKTNQKKKSLESRDSNPAIRLRSSYQSISIDDAKSMLNRNGFYDYSWSPYKTFKNQFEKVVIKGDEVVVDHATRLMWQQSGSSDTSNYTKARGKWIKNINQKGFAGYYDWRLPTLEEALSLMESQQKNGKLYIDPLFMKKQKWIWTGDQVGGSFGGWIVDFRKGKIGEVGGFEKSGRIRRYNGYVRGVRSIK